MLNKSFFVYKNVILFYFFDCKMHDAPCTSVNLASQYMSEGQAIQTLNRLFFYVTNS